MAASNKSTETVKVMVRTRPMNQKEFDRGKLYKSEEGLGQIKDLVLHSSTFFNFFIAEALNSL